MNLEFSVDKLYETGWHPEGSAIAGGVQLIFAAAGYELAIRYVQLFDCYRAVWTDRSGAAAGAVVGSDEREAAVYALAQLRKSAAVAATNS